MGGKIGGQPELCSGEERLWCAVLEQAMEEAVCTVNPPKVEWDGCQARYKERLLARERSRRYFREGRCNDILRALGVDVDWFLGKLGERYPEVFEV